MFIVYYLLFYRIYSVSINTYTTHFKTCVEFIHTYTYVRVVILMMFKMFVFYFDFNVEKKNLTKLVFLTELKIALIYVFM